MKIALLVCLSFGSLFALENSVVVFETTGSDQANMPVVMGRWFARGEVPPGYCAQPFIENEPAAEWQCIRKSSWPGDGSLQFAVIAFRVPRLSRQARVDFRGVDAGAAPVTTMSKDDLVSLGGWEAQAEFTFNAGKAGEFTTIRNARTMAAELPEADCAVRKWIDGPVVTTWIVEDRCASTASDLGGRWDADANAWVAAEPSHQSLHPMFVVHVYHNYPAEGAKAVRVEAGVENPWLSRMQLQTYRFALKAGPSLSTTREREVVNHYPWSRYRYEAWASETSVPPTVLDHNLEYLVYARAVPSYDFSVKVGLGSIEAEIAEYAWKLGEIRPGVLEDPAMCDVVKAARCGQGSPCCASWTTHMESGGARGELAPVNRWHIKGLYAFGNPDVPVETKLKYWQGPFLGNADAVGRANVHMRESSDGMRFCGDNNGTKIRLCGTPELTQVNAFGRPLSINARPTLSIETGPPVWTLVPGCAPKQPCHHPGTWSGGGWNAGNTNAYMHQISPVFVPYVLTGDWWYLEEMLFWAAHSAAGSQPFGNYIGARNGAMGYRANAVAIRTQAWQIRNFAQAAALAPDGSPEKEYFQTILKNNLAVEEGRLAITPEQGAKGYVPREACGEPCTDIPYWYGYDLVRTRTFSGVRPNVDNPLQLVEPPFGSGANVDPNSLDPTLVATAGSPWMVGYLIAAYTIIQDMGYSEADALKSVAIRPFLHVVLNPASNPYRFGAYRWPVTRRLIPPVAITDAVKDSDTQITWTVAEGGHGLPGPEGTATTIFICCDRGQWGTLTNTSVELKAKYVNETTFTTTGSYKAINTPYPGTMRMGRTGDGGYYDNWEDFFKGFRPDYLVKPVVTANNPDGDYPRIFRAALAMAYNEADGPYTAKAALEWVESVMPKNRVANRRSCGNLNNTNCDNPTWELRPRPRIENLHVTPAGTQVLFEFNTSDETDARVTISTEPFFGSTSDANDERAVCSGRTCAAVLHVEPETVYYFRVSASGARETGAIKSLGPAAVLSRTPKILERVDNRRRRP
jgi:hypothetical protein